MSAHDVNERTSARYSVPLTDQAGAAVTALTGLTLSLIDVETEAVINSRDAQNVLNEHNVTFVTGTVTWAIQPADNVIVTTSPSKTYELHKAIFTATWAGGGQAVWEVEIRVKNIPKVV